MPGHGTHPVDLHMHTVASDGTETVAARARDAYSRGMDAIALTDHDTINHTLVDQGQRQRWYDGDWHDEPVDDAVRVITGAELMCQVKEDNWAHGTDGPGIELLGYFLDPQDDALQALIDDMQDARQARMRRMVDDLNDDPANDVTLTPDQLPASRGELSQLLVDEGYVDNRDAAFTADYIGEDAAAYRPTPKPAAIDVLDAIHGSGGVASLAHPGRDLTADEADRVVAYLADAGLDAIEGPYTYAQKRDADGYTIHLGAPEAQELADRHDLLVTGGSDCHGRGSGKYHLGQAGVTADTVTALRDRADGQDGTSR